MTDVVQEKAETGVAHLSEAVRREESAYGGGEERPLRAFAGIIGAYSACALVGGVAAKRKGFPERLAWTDLALVTVATHKLSRLLAKDPVTSPLRAPFTRFEGTTGPAELKEEVRGQGARKALGELATCPFCIGHWVATGFVLGLVLAPRPTRLVASLYTALAGADALQLGYSMAEQRATS